MPPAGVVPPPRGLRAREVVLRLRVLRRAGFAAVLDAGFAREVAALRAPLDRLVPDDALARVEVAFFAMPCLAVERFAVERDPDDLRAPLPRDAPVLLPESSAVHLPDMTRWAASATASAISEPNLVALVIMLLAAWLAVSAASSPASRIARRALGLALIAAAAAANPAASISLLIAALAILSIVSEEEREEPLLEDLARADLAMASSPSVGAKTTAGP